MLPASFHPRNRHRSLAGRSSSVRHQILWITLLESRTFKRYRRRNALRCAHIHRGRNIPGPDSTKSDSEQVFATVSCASGIISGSISRPGQNSKKSPFSRRILQERGTRFHRALTERAPTPRSRAADAAPAPRDFPTISLLSDPGRPLRSLYSLPIWTDPPARKISFRNHTFRAGAACACTAGQKKIQMSPARPPSGSSAGKIAENLTGNSTGNKGIFTTSPKGGRAGAGLFFSCTHRDRSRKNRVRGGREIPPFLPEHGAIMP